MTNTETARIIAYMASLNHKVHDRGGIEATVQRVLASRWFISSPNLSKILRYITDQKLDGKEKDIKAYSIAVDALGKPEEFDAQNDPAVRIFVGRMRNALTDYYANEGANDPIRIVVPKGRYVPEFHSAIDDAGRFPFGNAWVNNRFASVAFAAFLVINLAILALLVLDPIGEPNRFGDLVQTEKPGYPVVDVYELESADQNARIRTAKGIRQQLISDLSHFTSIRVREVQPNTSPGSAKEVFPLGSGSFRLKGNFTSSGGASNLSLTLASSEDDIVIWSKSIAMPTNDSEFQNILLDTSRAIASELVSETGVINSIGIDRLKRRTRLLGNKETTNYQCLLLFFAFDQTKSESDETAARTCLKRLTIAETPDSSIWASWSLLRFLDWTKSGDVSTDKIIAEALSSANKAVELDPTNSIAYEYLGSILSVIGKPVEALEAYQRGLQLNPSRASLIFLIGWQRAVAGDWELGMPDIRKGIQLTPSPPGYMRIPVSMDAFRRGEFGEALQEADRIAKSGDQRGYVLALFAAIRLQDSQRIPALVKSLKATKGYDSKDPLKEIRRAFSNPEVLTLYERTLEAAELAW